MAKPASRVGRVMFIAYVIILHIVLILLVSERYLLPRLLPESNVNADTVREPAPGPQTKPATLPTDLPEPPPGPSSIPSPFPTIERKTNIIVPVQGVLPEHLTDTFTQSRSEDRTHEAIDIPASAGTPVLAAVDGEIVKFFDSNLGGTTIYQITTDRKYFLYYAHLERRDERITEKQFVRQGTIIGYVGDTGNAGAGNFHLHFSISAVSDPNRFWDGTPINPYPVLTGRAELW
jgi:murein DD-endopeptidase MepM/ murein hydrolase activator NlpD